MQKQAETEKRIQKRIPRSLHRSNFRGPRLFLTTWDKNGEKNIPIFETKKNVLLDRMIKNANDGKYY